MPLKVTPVAPVKSKPRMSTLVPTAPRVGMNESIATPVTVNGDELQTLPAVVATEILPGFAPRGTVAWISVSEPTVKSAGVLLNVTKRASVRLVPRMSTLVPTGPLLGVNELIVGVGTVNGDELEPVPLTVVTEMGPVVAPSGTVAWIWESESTVNLASLSLNCTHLAPLKLAPRISTAVPNGPPVGVNELIVGLGTSVNEDELRPVPLAVVTEIGPVVAPVGTCVSMKPSELTLNWAGVPLKVTAVAPTKLNPSIHTLVPYHPLVGVNEAMLGVGSPAASTSMSSKFAASGHRMSHQPPMLRVRRADRV